MLTTKLTIRLSLQEMADLEALAVRARLNKSELIRQWIRLGELPVREATPREPRGWRERP